MKGVKQKITYPVSQSKYVYAWRAKLVVRERETMRAYRMKTFFLAENVHGGEKLCELDAEQRKTAVKVITWINFSQFVFKLFWQK